MGTTMGPPVGHPLGARADDAGAGLATTPSARAVGLTVLLAVVAVLLCVLSVGVQGGPPRPQAWEVAAVAAYLLAGAWLRLQVRFGSERDVLDFTEVGLALGLVLLPAPALAATVVLTTLVAQLLRGMPRHKMVFNAAQWAASASAGAVVLALLDDLRGPFTFVDLGLLLLALVVVVVVNAMAVAAVIGRPQDRPGACAGRRAGPEPSGAGQDGGQDGGPDGGQDAAGRGRAPGRRRGALRPGATRAPVRRASAPIVGLSVVNAVLVLVLGLVLVTVWLWSPWASPLVLIALLAIHVGTRGVVAQRAAAERLLGLQRAHRVLQQGTGDVVEQGRQVDGFLVELCTAFACRGADLLPVETEGVPPLLPDLGDAPVPDPEDPHTRLAAYVAATGSAVRLSAAGDASGLLAGTGWRDCLAAPVRTDGAGGAEEVVAVLVVHDREGPEGFEGGELTVLDEAAALLQQAVQRWQAERQRVMQLRALERIARGRPVEDTFLVLLELLRSAGLHRCAIVVGPVESPERVVATGLPTAARQVLARAVADGLGPADARPTSAEGWVRVDLSGPRSGPAAAALRAHRVQSLWVRPDGSASGHASSLVVCRSLGERDLEPPGDAEAAAHLAGIAVEQAASREQLSHQAGHDPLTDLPNRAVFLEETASALGRAARSPDQVLVLFVDVDRFKHVNDSLGHTAGDELLCTVATRLRRAVRPGDVVARFGGDEFTVLCEGVRDEVHAVEIVRRLQAAVAEPVLLGAGEAFVTATVGMTLRRGEATPAGAGTSRPALAETLVEEADAAMYRAKERRRGSYELFDERLRHRAQRRLSRQNALHRAIEHEEFRVDYQPTVSLRTGEVVGVEALVRWEHPSEGLLPPAEFIPLAEDTGMIVPLGAQVLRHAFRQARAWADEHGPDAPTTAVNLSARQLAHLELVPLVREALAGSGADPSRITLEITESALISDVVASSRVLEELKALGLRIYVDDFGTGYSSLTHLQRFPLDGLKVDRSFVGGLGRNGEGHDDAAIVTAVVGLAHSLGLQTVAEGVESEQHVRHLIALDCAVGQGYYFGRPGPAEQVDLRPRRLPSGPARSPGA